MDAFSGDSVPTHLLAHEAMQVYLRHLKTDGLLAGHDPGGALDLRPVVASLPPTGLAGPLCSTTSGRIKVTASAVIRYGS